MQRISFWPRKSQPVKQRASSPRLARFGNSGDMLPARDSGMVSAFRPADYRKEGLAGFLSRVQSAFARALGRPSPQQTTEQGSSGAASPSSVALSLYSLRYERRQIITDARRIYEDDPRAFKSVNKYARESIRDGITITINTSGRGTVGNRAGRAKKVAEQVQKLFNESADGQPVALSWATMLCVEGDLFLQAVVNLSAPDGPELCAVKRMPAVSMERLTDDADEFINPAEAFAQVDVLTDQEVVRFPAWAIWHGRWNHIDGERYGRSELMSARRPEALLRVTEDSQTKRRLARAAQSRMHNVGNEEHPGTWDQVEEYKAKNGMLEGGVNPYDPDEVCRDFYGNGLTSLSVVEGDPNVHHIDDIKYLQDVFAVALPTPKAIYSLDAESINRDVLEDQRAEWLKETKTLSDMIKAAAGRMMEIGLLLAGILPESVDYTIHVSESSIETPDEVIGRAAKARQNTVGTGKVATPDPLISRQTAIRSIAEYFDIDDVEAEMALIDQERKERAEEESRRQQEAAKAEAEIQRQMQPAQLPAQQPGANGRPAPTAARQIAGNGASPAASAVARNGR